MTFKEAERRLLDRQMFGIKLGVSNIKKALRKFGNPEQRFHCIHIAGTNGKGSTAAMLAAILQSNGYRTGLYTSPHIATVRERFVIDGNMISKRDFARLYAELVPLMENIPLTYFECVTAMAFMWFSENKVDTAVVEVGLGGRFDATNVITPALSIITSIGYDHQVHLGDSLVQITKEKCGVIKRGVPVLSGVGQPLCRKIVKSTAEQRNAPYYPADDLVTIHNVRTSLDGSTFDARIGSTRSRNIFLPLAGMFQTVNAGIALASAQILKKNGINLSYKKTISGLGQTHWPDRFALIRTNPVFLIDVSHNEPGFTALKQELHHFFPGRKIIFLAGLNMEKDWANAFRPILPLCKSVTGIPVQRENGVSPESFARTVKAAGIPFQYFSSVKKGVHYAHETAASGDVILYAGSHYIADRVKKVVNSLDRQEIND